VVPAARRVLPAQTAHAWLAPCWRALAQRAEALPFRGADADSQREDGGRGKAGRTSQGASGVIA